jgi:hypothetical protein
VSVDVLSDNPIHKPVEHEELVGFMAQAGIDPEAWSEYAQDRSPQEIDYTTAMTDCMNQLGLPAPASVGTIASLIDSWWVEWSVVTGSPDLATINASESVFDLPGQFQHRVRRTSDIGGEAGPLIMNLSEETEEEHTQGVKVVDPLVVRAELETSIRPNLQTFINGARGGLGLASSLVELFAGLVQEMVQPSATANLIVSYHAGTPRLTGVLTAVQSYSCDFGESHDDRWTESGERTATIDVRLGWDSVRSVWVDDGSTRRMVRSVNGNFFGEEYSVSSDITEPLDGHPPAQDGEAIDENDSIELRWPIGAAPGTRAFLELYLNDDEYVESAPPGHSRGNYLYLPRDYEVSGVTSIAGDRPTIIFNYSSSDVVDCLGSLGQFTETRVTGTLTEQPY